MLTEKRKKRVEHLMNKLDRLKTSWYLKGTKNHKHGVGFAIRVEIKQCVRALHKHSDYCNTATQKIINDICNKAMLATA